MQDLLNLVDNAALQGFGYGIGVLGVTIAFRIVRYPDLTADGSFVLGAVVFAYFLALTGNWPIAYLAALVVGCMAGGITASLHSIFGVSRLLTGILTAMISYSLAFRILGGKPHISIGDSETMFSSVRIWDVALARDWGIHIGQLGISAVFAVGLCALVLYLLRSELGLLLRSSGANPRLVNELNRSHAIYQAIGLSVANGLVAMSGALIGARQGFADVNMGVGVIINLVAALVIGEEILRHISIRLHFTLTQRVVAPVLGAFLYFLFYLIILRASIRGWIPIVIQPTDLKMLSALVVIGVIAMRRSKSKWEDVLPL